MALARTASTATGLMFPASSYVPADAPIGVWLLVGFAAAALAVAARLWHVARTRRRDDARVALTALQLQNETRRRQVLLRLHERALAGGRMDALCRNATAISLDALGLPYCVVLESRPDVRTLTVAASAGWDALAVEGVDIDAQVDSQAGYALVAREPVVIADAQAEQKFPLPEEFRVRGARSGLAVRIGAARPWGVLAMYDSAPRAFDEAEVQFACGVAAILASAYERRRLEDECTELVARDEVRHDAAQLAARRAAFLAQTATVLDAALDPNSTLVSLARLAVPAIADCAVVDRIDEDGRARRIDVVDIDPIRRHDAETLRRMALDLRTEGPFPRAIRTGQPVLLPELPKAAARAGGDTEQLRLLARLGCQSLLLIPLVARGQTLGLLTLGSRLSSRYDGADLTLAQELAGRAAIALDNGRLHREAELASRAKDEFLAMVSHELRTPLNAVLGWAAILRTQPLEAARSRQALDAIDRSVHAQAQLVEQLLDVSRIVSGKFQLRLASVRLQDVVAAAVDAVKPAADDRGIRIDTRLDESVPPITADGDRLQQVVVNLATNAIKFTPDEGFVDVELRRGDDAGAELVVRDCGIGIKPEFLPHVFERFRQSDAQAASPNRGLGLGLAIVREIVEKHGGSVMAESAGEGKGATFRVRLPLHPATEPVGVGHQGQPGARPPLFRVWTEDGA